MNPLETFFWGCVGGIALPLLELWNIHTWHQKPSLRSSLYWVPRLVLILLGGLLAVAYVRSGDPLNPRLAIHVGATGPLALIMGGDITQFAARFITQKVAGKKIKVD